MNDSLASYIFPFRQRLKCVLAPRCTFVYLSHFLASYFLQKDSQAIRYATARAAASSTKGYLLECECCSYDVLYSINVCINRSFVNYAFSYFHSNVDISRHRKRVCACLRLLLPFCFAKTKHKRMNKARW